MNDDYDAYSAPELFKVALLVGFIAFLVFEVLP